MNVLEYLQKKYGVDTPSTILFAEAKIFGIPTPLKHGWLKKYGSIELSPGMVFRLRQSLQVRAKNGQQFAPIGLEVLDGQKEERPQNTPKPKQKKEKKKPNRQKTKTYTISSDVMSDAFLSTYEWRKVRMVALKKYGAKCQCCGATPATGAVINVDHIKPRKIYPDLALDVNNLQVLCHECNHGKGNWDMTDWRKTEKT